MVSPLYGRSIYSFGDSLMCGHHNGIGMLDWLTKAHGMKYTKYAINGASVIPGLELIIGNPLLGPDIIEQIALADGKQPDFVCFDGLTNDAYDFVVKNQLGGIRAGYEGGYDENTFIGGLETICFRLREKYPSSRLLYVCTHKMPNRSIMAQDTLQRCAREVCEKWSIPYVDVYRAGQINTCLPAMRAAYSYDGPNDKSGGNGTHLNPEGYLRWYAPLIVNSLIRLIDA